MEEKHLLDDHSQAQLSQLLNKIETNPIIQEYRQIEKKVKEHQGLQQLIENIKKSQKEAVAYAHYGKTEAEKLAIKKADELTQEFEEHPLVIAYREQLLEANDLLQFMMRQLNQKINDGLVERYQEEQQNYQESKRTDQE